MARHPDGPERVDRLDGSALAKRRARVILEVISGRRTVLDACAELALRETRFEDLRRACLEGAIAALEPRKIGRPRKVETVAERRVRALETENEELQKALLVAQVREELAVGLPRARRRGKKARRRKEREAAHADRTGGRPPCEPARRATCRGGGAGDLSLGGELP